MDETQVLFPSYTDEEREGEAYFPNVDSQPEAYDGYKKLCGGIIEGCLSALAVPPPSSTPPSDPPAYARWARSWQRWAAARTREIHFASGRTFYVICEAAGLDADVFLRYLNDHGLLDDPAPTVPPGVPPGPPPKRKSKDEE